MQKIVTSVVVLLTILFPFLLPGQESFIAEMANVNQGNKSIYHVKSDGLNYRYDFKEEGIKGIVIVEPAKNKTAILMPEKKYVHYTETSSVTSRSNDPVQSLMTIKNRYTEKSLGEEKIAGHVCKKSELYADNQKIFTVWFSKELNFPLRIENHLAQDTHMELYAIKKQEIDVSNFVVPRDFIEVDDRMRPIIPEPPAPEEWNNIEIILPFNGEYSRGDLITFTVPKTMNYIVLINHGSNVPAKIIRKTFRNGKELPNNEQGPLNYRSQRIFEKEWVKNTYSWKEGDTKVLEIHEGKLSIEVISEN